MSEASKLNVVCSISFILKTPWEMSDLMNILFCIIGDSILYVAQSYMDFTRGEFINGNPWSLRKFLRFLLKPHLELGVLLYVPLGKDPAVHVRR